MPTAKQLPTLSAPSLRVTTSADQWTQYISGDMEEIKKFVPIWLRTKAAEEIANQIALGNSKQYTSIVDGSPSKGVDQADRKVTVFFVSALLARNLAKAKRVLEMAIRRVTKTRTGLLSTGWEWYLQKRGSAGFSLLGDSIPTELKLAPGDALVLMPKAPYAWFVDYNATRAESFRPRKRARPRKVAGGGTLPPRGFGFMIYAAKALRPELRRIGVSVLVRTMTGTASKARAGTPVLVFVVTRRAGRIQEYGG